MRLLTLAPRAGGLLFAAALLAAGCSGKSVGQVAGKVEYRSKPVAGAQVNFLAKKGGEAAAATLDGEGRFSLPAPLEAGDYSVYVTAAAAQPGPPGKKPAPAAALNAPRKALDPATSGVVVTVKPGPNDVPIELKD